MRFQCKAKDLRQKIEGLMPTHGFDGRLVASWGEDQDIRKLVIRNEGKSQVKFITSVGDSFRIPAQWIEFGEATILLSIFTDLVYKIGYVGLISDDTEVILNITNKSINIYKLNN
jgi:hypothetical protein